MFDKLKELNKLREQAKEMQTALASERATASESGAIVTLDGNMNLTDIEIADHLLNPESKEKLKIAIRQAHRKAMKEIQKKMAERMKKSGGFGLPNMG